MIACCVRECSCTFTSADDLILHLKSVHKPPLNFEYKCTFPACIQIFTNLYGYTKHLRNHKFNSDNNPTNSSSVEHTVKLDVDVPVKVRKTEANTEEIVEQNDIIFETELLQMEKSAVEFTLNLHQRANFSRSDVREIQKATQTFCTKAVENIEKLNITH